MIPSYKALQQLVSSSSRIKVYLIFNDVMLAQRCLESAFRVLVNLTHDNLDWCNASIGSHDGLPSVVRLLSTSHAQHIRTTARTSPPGGLDLAVHHLDRLCLILGILTNLVQLSDEAIERMRDISGFIQLPLVTSTYPACQNCLHSVQVNVHVRLPVTVRPPSALLNALFKSMNNSPHPRTTSNLLFAAI